MIRREQPDLIHLVTAPRTRVEQLALVHELGIPACIVEKPIAYQVADWKALVALEARTSTRIGVNAQVRYHPNLSRCREALHSGALGEVLFLDATAGSTICDQGVHVLDWAMSLIEDSPPVRVFGTATGAENLAHRMHPSPDTTTAQLEFANGVRALWNLGSSAPRVQDHPEVWKHCRVAAYAQRGHTLYEEFGRWEVVADGQTVASGAVDMAQWEETNLAAQAVFTNAMFDWMEGDAPVGTHLARSLQQWNAILGLYASAVYRKPIDLPFEPPDDLWERLRDLLRRQCTRDSIGRKPRVQSGHRR